jgi:hypothetical protein
MTHSSHKEAFARLDLEIKWNNESLQMSSLAFCLYSSRFWRMIRNSEFGRNEISIRIESRVKRSSLIEFISACHEEEYSITASNVDDLELLCREWEVLKVAAEVKDFIRNPSNFRELLIPSIIFGVEHDIDTSEYETFISSHFSDFIGSDSIFEIPLQIVDRIFSRVSSNSETNTVEKIDFIIRSLKFYGRKASILLRHIDARDVRVFDLWRLKEADDSGIEIEWSFLCKFTSSIVCDFLGNCMKHESILQHHDSLIEANRSMTTASQSSIAELGLRLSSFDSRLSDVENLLKSSSDRLEDVSTSLNRQIGGLSERLCAIEGRIRTQFGDHGARLIEVENSTKQIEIGLRESAERMDGQLGGIEKITSELRRTFETFRECEFVSPSAKLQVIEDEINHMKKSLESQKRKVIKYKPGGELKGIISFLTRKCGRDLHDAGLVSVTGSQSNAQRVVDFDSSSKFQGSSRANDWICYDFRERRVMPTHYSLRTCSDACSPGCFPTSWVIEISENGQSWEVMDRKSEGSSMNQRNFTKTFAIDTPRTGRLVRFRQAGPCVKAHCVMDLTSFELFGTLSGGDRSVE